MNSHVLVPNREAAIWARLMQAQSGQLSPEAAEYLLSISFGERDRERMRQLAERSEAGALSVEEREEFDSYLVRQVWACAFGRRCLTTKTLSTLSRPELDSRAILTQDEKRESQWRNRVTPFH